MKNYISCMLLALCLMFSGGAVADISRHYALVHITHYDGQGNPIIDEHSQRAIGYSDLLLIAGEDLIENEKFCKFKETRMVISATMISVVVEQFHTTINIRYYSECVNTSGLSLQEQTTRVLAS